MIPERISPVYNEDYSQQWGKIDYNGKTILDTISDEILCKVQEYIIEVHSFEIEKTLKLKFEKNGYELADRNNWTQSTVSILYWWKRL